MNLIFFYCRADLLHILSIACILNKESSFFYLLLQVDFDQFKDALILVLSSSIESPQAEQETLPKPGKV